MSIDMPLSYTADGAPGADIDGKGVNIQDPGPAGAAREMLIPDFPPGSYMCCSSEEQSKL